MSKDSYDVAVPTEDLDKKGNVHTVSGRHFSDSITSNGNQDVSGVEMSVEREEDVDLNFYPHGCCSRHVEKIEHSIYSQYRRYERLLKLIFKGFLLLAFLAYFIYCVQHRYYDEGSYVLTAIAAGLLLKIVCGRLQGSKIVSVYITRLVWYATTPLTKGVRRILRYLQHPNNTIHIDDPMTPRRNIMADDLRDGDTTRGGGKWEAAIQLLEYIQDGTYLIFSLLLLTSGFYLLAVTLFSVYLGLNDDSFGLETVQALLGIFCMILVCFVFSASPSRVNWHPVFWGFVIQFVFAILTLRTETGYKIFKWIGDLVNELVRLSDKGSIFVFGDSFLTERAGFFFNSAAAIIFFNALIFLLEYLGILEFVVLKIGGALALCLETGPVESVVAAANIFIGLAEAPLLVRPYLRTVTKSELHAIMVCGFASISGAFMAMFIKIGALPNHLLTAAIISAPAALAIAKLIYPEQERVDFASQKNFRMKEDKAQQNALQAFSDGAAFSVKLLANLIVNVIAFISLLNLVNSCLIWVGERAGVEGLTFDWLSSYILYPVAFLMGAPTQDCRKLASLLGIRLLATPFVAYANLATIIQNRKDLDLYIQTTNGTWHTSGDDIILDLTNQTLQWGIMTERSEVITTYALCGNAAFPAIGFILGTLVPMCPERKDDVVNLIIRAFIAGNLASIATGSVAGVMFTGT